MTLNENGCSFNNLNGYHMSERLNKLDFLFQNDFTNLNILLIVTISKTERKMKTSDFELQISRELLVNHMLFLKIK